ncbi:MAG: hypothetical protein IKO91_04510 [Oscillospiraceae bacterium]|nr:hypothetical protein [Oscillospiraceae bacterium]
MGLLSKLLGDEGSKQLGKLVKNVASEAEKAARQAGVDLDQVISGVQSGARPQTQSRPQQAAPAQHEPGPSGFSWGEEMPAEENQYNFAGPYTAYFEMIFREDFPGYRVDRGQGSHPRTTVYTLWQGVSKALVVEVMTQDSEAKKLRQDCAKAGIPYVRFYHDHDGWWNTRAYVVSRIRAALR